MKEWLSNIIKVTQLESDRAGAQRPAFLLPQSWLFPRQCSCSLGRRTLRLPPAPTHGVGLAAWQSYCVSGADVTLLGDTPVAALALTRHWHV